MGESRDDERRRMVERQVRDRGITDVRVLAAMATVPRERFVDVDLADAAYADRPLPIEEGQTISQPFIVAAMAAYLEIEPADRILEVGTGSGYGAAVLSRVGGHVDTIERHARLAETAARRLADLGYANVDVHVGDGSRGLPERAPFDVICVTAAGADVPVALLDQLADAGRLVMPVGGRGGQRLVLIRRQGDDLVETDLDPVAFVPLVPDRES
ncbi:MAG: protein-L-isoaspartate(D-aspartate) O-methyltransferase [Acidimicrobiia bacterium]|nr:protein-L-isoaspartate(D-aspartate) O-methyltransferase [Acidimicrobiia bacterium]